MIHSLFFHEFISKGELKESPWRLSEKLSVVKLFHSSGLVDTRFRLQTYRIYMASRTH